MSEANYRVKIINTSKEISAIERVRLKDLGTAMKLNDVVQTEPLTIDIDYTAILEVHNEKAERTDYPVYIVVDKSGKKFYTSSPSFKSSLDEVLEEMEGEVGWGIEVYKSPSKNASNQPFLKCTVCEIK